jgi:drug/metabolite transporter (DMT)-like permease
VIIGIGLAVVAIALVSGAGGAADVPTSGRVMATAMLAGAGFGAFFVVLAETSENAGLWPLLSARFVSIPLAIALVVGRGMPLWPQRRQWPLLAAGGAFDMLGTLLFLLASKEGMLSIVGVIGALYPVSTVSLAMTFDRERIGRLQGAGLVLAAGAVVCVALG